MMRFFYALVLLPLTLMARSSDIDQNTIEEMRIALYDMRRSYQQQQMDLQLIQERLDKVKLTPQSPLKDLENKIATLERMQAKMQEDLHQLSSFATETTQSLVGYKNAIDGLEKQLENHSERMNEIVKLKSTLNSISKAMNTPQNTKIHKVRSGDTLDKLARQYNTNVETLKQLNGLSNPTIIVGQELKIPE